MNTQMEKNLVNRALVLVPVLMIVMAAAILLLCRAQAGSAVYYTGCTAAVLGFCGATGVWANTWHKLEKMD